MHRWALWKLGDLNDVKPYTDISFSYYSKSIQSTVKIIRK